ncbi:creatine transporter-like [Convolutriloba macropyga]|uniref:creatine transporter-like n=1 Tax=Convolutriloba macropyga TaxID=536237 RepID=UPI003F524F3C
MKNNEKSLDNVAPTKVDREGRETWSGRFDCLMTLIGFSVGLGNIWRFPYLCFKNGGGVFLIPYCIALFGVGVPLLFLQIALGQFMSRSGPDAWNLYPLSKGLGVASIFIQFYVSLYYIVIIAWIIFYFYSTLTFDDLPWTTCLDSYGPLCLDNTLSPSAISNGSSSAAVVPEVSAGDYKEPAELFWTKGVLGLSDSMEEVGSVQGHMALSLLVAWIIVYVCIIRGIKWTGKIVWFTGLIPYAMLLILLIRALTLEGAWNGVKFYLNPDFSKLSEGSVWLDAGTQILFSMALGEGTLPTLGSYNKFHHNSLRDSFVYSIVNCLTSFIGGFCIFATLGYMAHERNVDIASVTAKGPGLTFIAYPKALSLLPFGAKVLSALFFLMMLFLGLDSEFVAVEGLTCQIMDTVPNLFRFRFARQFLLTFLSILCYSVGLIFTTNAGMYFFQILDFYSASGFVVLFLCFYQAITIAYLYGGRRFMDDIEAMMSIRRGLKFYLLFCWYFATPFICVFIFVIYWFKFAPLKYEDYTYPTWSSLMGWTIALSSCLAVPVTALYQLYKFRHNTSLVSTAVLRDHQIHPKTRMPYRLAPGGGGASCNGCGPLHGEQNSLGPIDFTAEDPLQKKWHIEMSTKC